MKCRFPEQTRDSVELLFHKDILENFKSYGEFWEEFIGVRLNDDTGLLRPYSLDLSKANPEKHELIKELHEKICMAHYGCFCHLASAHHLLRELRACKDIANPARRHFSHWHAFEAAYLSLGAAWQEIKILWEYVLVKLDAVDEAKKDSDIIWNYFEANGKDVKNELEEMDSNIIKFRDEIAHFSRHASRQLFDTYYIPAEFRRGRTWSEQIETDEWNSTEGKLHNDIETVEETFESTHRHLIEVFRNTLAKHSILIDQDSGEEDEFCGECGWRVMVIDVARDEKKSNEKQTNPIVLNWGYPGKMFDSSANVGSSSVPNNYGIQFPDIYNGSASAFVYSLSSVAKGKTKVKICINPECGYLCMV